MFNNLLLTNVPFQLDAVTIQVVGWFELQNLLSQRTLYSKLNL